jgi:hypothetical protein
MPILPRALLRLMTLAVAACCAPHALAVDAISVPLPAAVEDLQLTWGTRTLALPPGQWTLVARSEGVIHTKGINRRSAHYTVYAMDTAQGRLHAGLVMRLPAASTPAKGWREEPCKLANALLRDDFGGDLRRPQCLLVLKRRTHLASSTDPLYAQARAWAAANKVDTRGPVYEIMYARYASNDFGWLRVYVPAADFGGDEQAIAWARQLPALLQPFFEKRITQAALPALPRKGS